MTKKILFLLMLGTVASLPNSALAESKWLDGTDGSFINPANWDNGLPHNEYYTEIAVINTTNWETHAPIPAPTIDSSVNVTWDSVNINGLDVTMTGGSVRLLNGTSHQGLALEGLDWTTAGVAAAANGWDAETVAYLESLGDVPGTFTMTGGTFTVDRVGLGYNVWDPEKDPSEDPGWRADGSHGNGYGYLTLAGDSVFTIEPNVFIETGFIHYLWIHTGSYIDIQDDGMLRVPLDLSSIVDGYIAEGKIIASTPGDNLYNLTSGDEYVIFASSVPPIPGDADQDQDVDETDLTILASNWLSDTGMTWSTGDFNLDGVVNQEDASMLAANLGVGVPPAASVPEPGTLLLLCLGLGCVTLLRRK
jgi:hypothetical protein